MLSQRSLSPFGVAVLSFIIYYVLSFNFIHIYNGKGGKGTFVVNVGYLMADLNP